MIHRYLVVGLANIMEQRYLFNHFYRSCINDYVMSAGLLCKWIQNFIVCMYVCMYVCGGDQCLLGDSITEVK